jgi:hypothetical protein
MKNKKMIYIVGGLAVLAIGYYIYKKRKTTETPKENVGGDIIGSNSGTTKPVEPISTPSATPSETPSETPSATPSSTPAKSPTSTQIQLSKSEVEKRVLKTCGIRPSGAFKEKRNRWDNCKDETKANLKSQGLISFDGEYMDFDGDLDNLQDL